MDENPFEEAESGLKKPGFKDRIKKLFLKIGNFVKSHKVPVIISSIALLIIALGGLGIYFLRHGDSNENAPVADDQPVEENNSNLYPNVLDGLLVSKKDATRHPLAVIVENHIDARPQSGLNKASIIYEAIAEGGITRFLALFSTYQPQKVGPVRSARTYFVDWAHGYDAFIAHVGGNMDALDQIKAEKLPDLDQFLYTMPYWREYSSGLALEHTMYTSTVKLWEQASKNGYSKANNFTEYKFKDDPLNDPSIVLPSSQKITVNFSSYYYNVYFVYDKKTNSYKRYMAGKPHLDKITKNQLNPKNLIVMTVRRKPVVTRINENGYDMYNIGTGTARVFLDGKEIDATWKKNSASDREIFYDKSGQEIEFNRGQFWICVIPPESGSSVSVQ